MRGVFKFYTVEYLWPFTGAWLTLKIATDERPGAEMIQLVPHHADSSYAAFQSSNLYGFAPLRKGIGADAGSVPAVNYVTRNEESLSYPKMYMVMVTRRSNALEDWLKFYLMPFLMNIFVMNYTFEESD